LLRFHLGFPSPSIADLKMLDNAALAQKSEELCFDVIWHSNERFFREMFVRMASSAMATTRITLGGAVVEPFAVHPVLTAQSIASVDELSGGRTTLAIGAGGSGFQMMGIKRQHSARALREAYTILKPLLSGEEVTFEGELIQAYKARLQFKPVGPVPLWIATRGDLTLETSGEYAEAIMLATYAHPDGIGKALELIHIGAKKAGRSLEKVRILSRVDTCVHVDPKIAYDGTRHMIARILWGSYPDKSFINRAGLNLPKDIEELLVKKDNSLVPQIARLIPDNFVDAFCWAGTPAMVADRIVAIARADGIQEFGFWVLCAQGQTREEAMELIAQDVIPRVQLALNDKVKKESYEQSTL